MRRHITRTLVLIGVCSLYFAGIAFAQVPDAPEIDAGSAAGALTLVAGALTILRERWRRR